VVLFVNTVTHREGCRAVSSRRATEDGKVPGTSAWHLPTTQGAERWWGRPTALKCYRIYEQDH